MVRTGKIGRSDLFIKSDPVILKDTAPFYLVDFDRLVKTAISLPVCGIHKVSMRIQDKREQETFYCLLCRKGNKNEKCV